jgi:hypothetical protein
VDAKFVCVLGSYIASPPEHVCSYNHACLFLVADYYFFTFYFSLLFTGLEGMAKQTLQAPYALKHNFIGCVKITRLSVIYVRIIPTV